MKYFVRALLIKRVAVDVIQMVDALFPFVHDLCYVLSLVVASFVLHARMIRMTRGELDVGDGMTDWSGIGES